MQKRLNLTEPTAYFKVLNNQPSISIYPQISSIREITGMWKKIHHIGFVVHDIEKAIDMYKNRFGLTPSDRGISETTEHGIRTAFFTIGGENTLEFVQPTNENLFLGKYFTRRLEEHGEGPSHIAVDVEDFDGEIASLKKQGITVELFESTQLFPGTVVRFAFILPEETGGLGIEFADAEALPPGV
jgi:methylmalonyl-CoA epimerase